MKTGQTTPTATLIQCGTRAFCLRLSNGGEAAGAYLSEKQAAYLRQIVHRYRRQHGQCDCEECKK